LHVNGCKEETMKPEWKAIALGLAVLCLSAPAAAQSEPSGRQGDADRPAAESNKSDGAKVGWQPKFSGFTFKVGAQMDVAPGKANGDIDAAFALMLGNEYHIYKPLWLETISGLYVNGKYIDFPVQIGFLLKLIPGKFVPTLRATATVDFRYYFYDRTTPAPMGDFDILVGSTFGPGFRLLFGDRNQMGLVIDLDFFLGKNMYATGAGTGGNFVWSMFPMVGIEF
jgi:hypothetical protein